MSDGDSLFNPQRQKKQQLPSLGSGGSSSNSNGHHGHHQHKVTHSRSSGEHGFGSNSPPVRAKSPAHQYDRSPSAQGHLPSVSPLRRMISTPAREEAASATPDKSLNVAINAPTPMGSSSPLTPLPNAPTLQNNIRAGRRLAVTGGTRSSASGRPTAGMGQRAATPTLRRGREKREEEKRLIDRALKTNLRLLQMETDQIASVVAAMIEVKFRGGDVIVNEGTQGDTFYVIAAGKCDVFVTENRNSKEDGDEHLRKKHGQLPSSYSFDPDDLKDMEGEAEGGKNALAPLEKPSALKAPNTPLQEGNGAPQLGKVQTKKHANGNGFGKLVRVLGPGDTFGELALMTGGLRTATVVAATTEVLLWEVDRNTFETIIFQATKKKRIRFRAFLARVPILRSLSEYQRDLLADALQQVTYEKGVIVMKEGVPSKPSRNEDGPADAKEKGKKNASPTSKSDGGSGEKKATLAVPGTGEEGSGSITPGLGQNYFHIIEEGQCHVTKDETSLRTLKEGDYFGEVSLMDGVAPTATVTATTIVKCLRLDKDSFVRLMGPLKPALKRKMTGYRFETNDEDELGKEGGEGENDEKKGGGKNGGGSVDNEEDKKKKDGSKGSDDDRSLRGSKLTSFATVMLGKQAITVRRRRSSLEIRSILTSGRAVMHASQFQKIDRLGAGAFGRVYLARHLPSGSFVALKVMRKTELIRTRSVTHVKNEREIMTKVTHPFVVNNYGTFQTNEAICFVTEYIVGSRDLYAILRSGVVEGKKLPPPAATLYAAEVVTAMEAVHQMGYIYRDLKPENLLVDGEGHLKMIDFGFARKIDKGMAFTLCGTPQYVAPEVIQRKGHGMGVDFWAIGILIYEMLSGYPPFHHANHMVIYEKILAHAMHGNGLEFPEWFPSDAEDLVRKLLVGDVTRRYGCMRGGIDDIRNHEFFKNVDWKALLNRTQPGPLQPVVQKYARNSPIRHVKKLKVVPITATASAFREGDGELSADEQALFAGF